MSGTNNNKQTENLKTTKPAKLLLGFTVISFLCFVGFLLTAANIAGVLFLVSVIVTVILGTVSIFKIKLAGGKLKDMGLPVIGGIIIPIILAGIILAGIVIGNALDSAGGTIRLIICRKELETLGNALQVYSTKFGGKYPTADKWCDLLVQHTDVDKTSFGKFARDGRSSYAINPDAEPNSPPDVVLLFENDAAWNQAGKAELLTFENKEPKRYMILFNGRNIRLVKPEDVNTLKWK